MNEILGGEKRGKETQEETALKQRSLKQNHRSEKEGDRGHRQGVTGLSLTPLQIQSHLIFIQPNVCQPQGVVCHGVLAFRRPVWSPFSENVSDSRARDDEEFPPTHPNLGRSKVC